MLFKFVVNFFIILVLECNFACAYDIHLLPELFHFEDYDNCAFYRNGSDVQYCLITVRLYPEGSNVSNNKIWNIIQDHASDRNNYRYDLLRHGICVKCEISNDTISTCVKQRYLHKYSHLGLSTEITQIKCEIPQNKYNFKIEDLIYMSFLLAYIILVFLASIFLKILEKKRNDEQLTTIQKFSSNFSIFHNLNQLFNEKPTTKTTHLDFIDGIRFVASIGVIITHATVVNLVTPVSNPSYVEEIPKRYVTMILANGGMMVQVYFVISSWLMAKSFYQKSRSLMYCLKRIVIKYIRLSLAYALVIFAHGTWLVRLFRGPFWDSIIGEDYRVCRRNWWKNLLYFNNFVIDDGLCMFQSWYLSVDFQFTILGILILWLTQKKPKILYFVSGFVICFQIIFMFFYLLFNNFEIAVVMTPEILYDFRLIYMPEWQATWTTTFSNLSGLAIGLCFGYYYFLHQNEEERSITKINSFFWWATSLTSIFCPLLFSSYYMTTKYYSNSLWFASAYGSICKTIYAFGMGLLILGMAKGYGGYIKKVLEWKPLYLLGYFSFGVYLVHYTFLKINAAIKQSPPYVTDYTMVSDVTTNITMSYICSAILTIFFLMPANNLLRFLS